jgi:hypothetical protein
MNDDYYLQQRNVIKSLTKLEKSGSGIYEMLKEGFGEEPMSCARVFFFWTKEFLNGRGSVEDELRSGRPVKVRADENIRRTEELVRSDRLRQQIPKEKKKQIWCDSRRVRHDNAPAHSVFRVKELLVKKNITVVEHVHCSPDLAPSDFFLFPRIKNTLKGEHFDDIKSNTAIALNGISESDFQACFQSWETCMHTCGRRLLRR